jgi:hypothetical protein
VKTRHIQTNKAAYWAMRNDVYEPVERAVTRSANDAANRSSIVGVERAVDSASGWAVFTTLNMAVEGGHRNPKHSGLQDFLRGIDFQ